MKKLLSIIFCAAFFVTGLTACSNESESSSAAETSESSATEESETEAEITEAADSSTQASAEVKTLVVYYSATGSTEAAAQTIANAANADLFEITPTDEYTSDDLDYNNEQSRVYQEYLDESKRDVSLQSTSVDGWESYTTVFIGYPIWWGDAAWVLNGFVSANDFTGKTVIPFCTSASSGIGDSAENLAELAGTGDWQEGKRFQSSADSSEITSWVESLGL